MRALIASSDRDLVSIIAAPLSAASHIIETVRDGQDAVDMICNYDFDIALLGSELKQIRCADVIGRIRSADMRMPVLIISEDNTDAKDRLGRRRGILFRFVPDAC